MNVRLLSVILGGAMITGCASGASSGAKAPPNVFQLAEEELSHTIGTATLTSAPIAKPAHDRYPLYLTDEPDAPAATRTWGAASPQDPAEANDLAQNPYRDPPDLYDPR